MRYETGIIVYFFASTILFGQSTWYDAPAEIDLTKRSSDVADVLGNNPFALEGVFDAESYIVGPGDLLIVSIIDIESSVDLVMVSPVGDIVVPGIGLINVRGMLLTEVQIAIQDEVRIMLPGARAICSLSEPRNVRVNLTGAVYKPGLFTIPVLSRVSDVLTLAGDALFSADLSQVQVKSTVPSASIFNLNRYFIYGELNENPQLVGGEVIIVPFLPNRNSNSSDAVEIKRGTILIGGEVYRPGPLVFQPGLSISDYIAMAGGQKATSQRKFAYIERQGKNLKSGLSESVQLGDAIFVPVSSRFRIMGAAGWMQAVLMFINAYMAYLATRN